MFAPKKKGGTQIRLYNKSSFIGHYLYVGYPNGVTTEVSGAGLRSPSFPPPPKYNNNASSPYYKSCRVCNVLKPIIKEDSGFKASFPIIIFNN